MLYCSKCGISIRGNKRCCPLCQGELTGTPSEAAFPTLKRARITSLSLVKLFTFLFIALEIVWSAVGFLANFTLAWVCLLYTSVLRASGFVRKGARALAAGRLNVEVLDAASIICAFAQRTPKTAASIMLLLRISECLEDYTRKKTKDALAGSLAVNVDRVWQVTEKGDVSVPLSSISPGDRIRVQAGNLIPVDLSLIHI